MNFAHCIFAILLNAASVTMVALHHQCHDRTCETDALCAVPSQGLICSCKQGYVFLDETEDVCVDMDECARHMHDPCSHRGRCINTVGGYRCECLHGWDLEHEHCKKKTSQDAKCMPGYTGDHCQESVCGAHGYAVGVDNTDEYICECEEGWTKTNPSDPKGKCDADVNECLKPDLCHHGAICTNTIGSYLCNCAYPWMGKQCSEFNCSLSKCENGGTCTQHGCMCSTPWTGFVCSIKIPSPTSPQSPITATTALTDSFTHSINHPETQPNNSYNASDGNLYKELFYGSLAVAALLAVFLASIMCTLNKHKRNSRKIRSKQRGHERKQASANKDTSTVGVEPAPETYCQNEVFHQTNERGGAQIKENDLYYYFKS